jgi:hypothetical protein
VFDWIKLQGDFLLTGWAMKDGESTIRYLLRLLPVVVSLLKTLSGAILMISFLLKELLTTAWVLACGHHVIDLRDSFLVRDHAAMT